MAETTVQVTNKKGVHARAAAKFVKTASQFDAKVMVAKIAGSGVDENATPVEVSANSILGLMMLGAECGSILRLKVNGNQADEALKAVEKLILDKFDEE